MKKSLIAIAALAATGAFAQSSVTLYGIGDIWFGTQKTGVGAAEVSQTLLNSGGLSGSRFGLRGSEDLGGGLSAVFQFENGFSLDSGATSTTNQNVLTGGVAAGANGLALAAPGGGLSSRTPVAIFGRQAFIGLNGGFGNIRLGRQYSSYDELRGGTDTMGHTTFSSTVATGAWENVGTHYTFRVNNMMRYESPNMGGFTANISYGLGENKSVVAAAATATASATTVASADNLMAFKLQYANGPIMAGLAYQNEKNGGAGIKLSNTLFAGSYDFGVAKLNAGYNRSSQTGGVADKEFQFGVTVPFGAHSVAASYANAKTETAGVAGNKGNTFALQAIYGLSKRTNLYGGYAGTKIDTAAGAAAARSTTLAAGVRHTF